MSGPPAFNQDDHELLTKYFTDHQAHLYNVLRRYIRNEHQREDFVQDVFTLVLRKWRLYDRERPFWPWLLRVTLNYLYSQMQNRRWRAHLSNLEDVDSLMEVDAAAGYELPVEAMIRSEDHQRLRDRVAGLPDTLRDTVTLRYWESRSCPEIANIMEVPVGTVWSRLHEAHRLLGGR
jgi:RNA polymerase sigma-70 factor (ECF subfamily)